MNQQTGEVLTTTCGLALIAALIAAGAANIKTYSPDPEGRLGPGGARMIGDARTLPPAPAPSLPISSHLYGGPTGVAAASSCPPGNTFASRHRACDGAAGRTHTPVPAPPFLSIPQQVARKALDGCYGPLTLHQAKGYTLLLEQDARIAPGRAWLTHYTPSESFRRGKPCAYWGFGASERIMACIPIERGGVDFRVGYYVLVELPGGWEIRQIGDTGAKSNLRVARRKGCRLWLDRWSEDKRVGGVQIKYVSWQCRYVVIKSEKTWR